MFNEAETHHCKKKLEVDTQIPTNSNASITIEVMQHKCNQATHSNQPISIASITIFLLGWQCKMVCLQPDGTSDTRFNQPIAVDQHSKVSGGTIAIRQDAAPIKEEWCCPNSNGNTIKNHCHKNQPKSVKNNAVNCGRNQREYNRSCIC